MQEYKFSFNFVEQGIKAGERPVRVAETDWPQVCKYNSLIKHVKYHYYIK